MKSCDNKRCINKSENCTKYNFKGSCDSCIYYGRDRRTDLPSDRTYNKMRSHYSKYKTAEWNYNTWDHLRRYFSEKPLKINKYKRCHDRRDQRCKDLCQCSDHLLENILVLLCCLLHCILGNAFHSCHFYKIIVKISDCISDDHLKLSRLCEASLYHLHSFDCFHIRLWRIIEYKTHSGYTMWYSCNVLFSSDEAKQLLGILCILSHFPFLHYILMIISLCSNLFKHVVDVLFISRLFKHVNMLFKTCLNISKYLHCACLQNLL